ncbi:hypothetical protein IscW_ISCW000551 [Ixodes scapularis]|uniref:Uncharacterized protein n=1 Tax=Ixodes scapularis TaxID=6945 RepID=B7P617_IXOSC|nr:hypothetical protein IscW_ISCW000551 [Ixodes scapularis]|eukprot:XP_002408196.1 hypothetical protein IscW_ISCW000551 [Ixodes scapularis]
MMSQDHLLKLDAVLSSEQMRALLQDAGGPHSHSDKLDFDVLGNVGGAEDGSHPLAAIEDSLHDLENLVLEQGSASGALFTETTDADVEALLKATLGAEDLLSPMELVFLDHCYSMPLGAVPVGEGVGLTEEHSHPAAQQDVRDCTSPSEDVDSEEAHSFGASSPGSPQLPLRRSQRQIERIDRERLERIKAENAELKRKEQEEMGRGQGAALASPSPAKDKAPKVLALPAQPSPAKRSKPRNSESFSSDGTLEDVSLSSPSHGVEEAAARPRKKRQRSHDLDEIARDVAKLHEAPAKKGVAKKGVEPVAKGPSKKDAKRAAIKEESRGEGAGLKRKAEEAEKEGKKKPLPQEVSPFGKVVKVVRTTPEVKKKPRRESFTDEPALFSQPDVLIKEHEPHLGPNPPSTPTPGPLPNPLQAGEKDIHMEESSYDTVEAHVARLAGGDHGLPQASQTVPVVPATVVAPAPAPALVPAVAPASALPVAHPPKPTLATHTPKASPKPAQPPKVSFPAAVQKKPNAVAPKPGQGPERKRPLAIAIKSAPPPLPSQAKPKPAEHPAMPTHPHVPPAHPKPAKATKGGEGVVKGAGHPKKGAEQQVKKVKVPKPEPPPPFPPVAERPKRQSKEKFKRAMMRKREMGRRVDDEDVDDSSEEQHGSDWSSEDDPEKLWCICRQPHNDKFMIQCDKCEDWFHGTCVGVTRQQGRLWEKENREWMCPKCAKALGVESLTPAPAKKEAQHPPDGKSQPKALPKVETPVKLAPKGVLRECLVCKRRTECVGLYCGRDCIAKYVNDASQTIKVEVKKQPPPQPEIEPVRINVRKVLRDSLSNRCKDADDISLSGDEVKRMAVRIEEELFKYFKDTGTKYKSKYRSLVFNIKDTRNQGLFRKILKGKIAPDKLVRMTPEELASKELAKWRERENQHVAPPPLPTTSTDEVPAASVSPQHRRRGSATPADTGADLSSSSSSSSSASSSAHASPPPPPPPTREGATSSRSDTPPPPPPPPSSHLEKKGKKSASRRSRDDSSDLEPSSTVSLGSPDSGVSGSRGSQGGKGPSSVWKGFISMQEVSKFVTSAYKVSGPTDFLSQDIPDTINVCGRIIPDQVWDYLSKIKQSGNKELLVIRFQPANEEEKKPYRELYGYLNSRKRCGVVGGLSRMLKDFYILPLPSHSPVPTVLMPFEGPGLMSGRPHMLLGIIVEEQKRLIELQRLQAITMVMNKAGSTAPGPSQTSKTSDASGIPFLDSSLPMDTGLSFLSGGSASTAGSGPEAGSTSCSLPSTLQELLNKVKGAAPRPVFHSRSAPRPRPSVGALLASSRQSRLHPAASAEPIAEIIVSTCGDATQSRLRGLAAGETPPPPGKAATPGSTGSKLGAKSASELMEMARKQLEEMEGVAMAPSMPVAPPAPAPMFVQPPPAVPVAPPMMGAPPPGMYGPPPPMDGGFVPPPPQGMGFPPEAQWGPAGGPPGYWKGPPPSVPPPPPPTGWNGGGRGDYRQRGGDWRSGGGRRSQWDQRR